MKSLLTLIFILCSINAASAQGWTWQYPQPTNWPLRDVHLNADGTGVAVGHSGTCLTTADFGETWRRIPLQTTADLHAVTFSDNQSGWAAGAQNTVLHTTDGGAMWLAVQPPVSKLTWWQDVWAGNGKVWACGTAVWSSADGFKWTRATLPVSGEWRKIQFQDAQNGWVLGEKLCYTHDGGATWRAAAIETTDTLTALAMFNATEGYALAAGEQTAQLFFTRDGGANWDIWGKPVAVPYPVALRATDKQHVTIFGAGNQTAGTVNAGQNWEVVNLPRAGRLCAVSFADAQRGVLVGYTEEVYHIGVILRTTDGGQSWRWRSEPTASMLSAVHFTDARHGYAVGRGALTGESGLLLGTKDGQSWAKIDMPGFVFNDVVFLDSLNGYVCGANNSANTIGSIWRTTNGGRSWDSRNQSKPMNRLHFRNATDGWAVGRAGRCYHTTNGSDWKAVFLETTADLYDVQFVSESVGWIAGAGGLLLQTTDGGETWAEQPRIAWDNHSWLQFTSSDTGFTLAGQDLHATTDGGVSWRKTSLATYGAPQKLCFISGTKGWLVTEEDGVFVTGDGGRTWTAQPVPPNSGLSNVFFLNETTGWVVGARGAILGTTDGGGSVAPKPCLLEAKFKVSRNDACAQQTVGIAFTGVRTDAAKFVWTLDNAVIGKASADGPTAVHWTTEGRKTLQLTLTDAVCTRTSEAVTVEVRPYFATVAGGTESGGGYTLLKLDTAKALTTAIAEGTADAAGRFTTPLTDTLFYLKMTAPDALPTYYPGAAVIQQAARVAAPCGDTLRLDVAVIRQNVTSSGAAYLDGYMTAEGGEPAVQTPVLLMNGAQEPVGYAVTDADGYFQFDGLADGAYEIWVDKWGVNVERSPVVHIQHQAPLEELQLTLHEEFVELHTMTRAGRSLKPTLGQVWAANGAIYTRLREDARLTLVNLQGQVALQYTVPAGEGMVLPPFGGVYAWRLECPQGSQTGRVLLQK